MNIAVISEPPKVLPNVIQMEVIDNYRWCLQYMKLVLHEATQPARHNRCGLQQLENTEIT